VAEESYWAAQQRAAREALRADLVVATAAADVALAGISADERALLDEHAALETAARTSKNAAQRRARLALDRWFEEHRGARWDILQAKGQRCAEAVHLRNRLAGDVTTWDAAPLIKTDGLEVCLVSWGFLDPSSKELTLLGKLGSDIAEGHNILMPLLAESGKTTGLPAEQLAVVLAAFIREGGGMPGEGPTLADATDLSEKARELLGWLDGTAQACLRDEDRAGVLSPPGFWDLSALWVCIVSRYLAGAGLAEIAAEFGLYEGNVQRGLLKVVNLLEEWAVVCELRRDLVGLEQVRQLRLLREDVVVDSLYLRL
jgi:hypothetical protein